MAMRECPKCECMEIDSGWVLSAGKIAYKSDKLRYPIYESNCKTP